MGDSIFPIRYGIMEIEEEINIGTPIFSKIKVYVACKCYIVTEMRKYKKDGSFVEKCEGVFLFKKVGDRFERVEPIFSGDDCINRVLLSESYTDFSLASKGADELNKAAFREFATTVPYDSEFKNKVKRGKDSHELLLAKYKEEETSLEEMTKHLNGNVKRI